MSRVLVTGGAGFIGRHLCARLAVEGHEVVAVDRTWGGPAHQTHPAKPHHQEQGDLTQPGLVAHLVGIARPEVVVHLAADTATATSNQSPVRPCLQNVVGTATLLECLAERCRPDHFVLASSRAVYGEGPWAVGEQVFHPPLRRRAALARGQFDPEPPGGGQARPVAAVAGRTPVRPASVYGATKLAQEQICQAWAAGHDVPLSVLRLQNVYGPGQPLASGYSSVMALFSVTALRQGAVEVFEGGGIIRDLVFVDDVVEALAAAVQRPPAAERVLDVGAGVPRRLLDVAAAIAERCGAPAPEVSDRFRPGDVRAAWCDPQPTHSELGWNSTTALDAGLDALVEWARQLAGVGAPRPVPAA